MDVRLEALSSTHAPALLAFELANRAFFAGTVGDRGEAYFARFDDRVADLIAEREAGTTLPFVLVDAAGQVVGRVNVSDIQTPEETEIGFRVAEAAQGRGLATQGVRLALEQARAGGVARVRARASTRNVGSQRVLTRCGFTPTGPTPAPPGSTESFLGYAAELV